METYTIAVCEKTGEGTHYVTTVKSEDIEAAKQAALNECLENWGDNYRGCVGILFVMEGEPVILEYQEPWL